MGKIKSEILSVSQEMSIAAEEIQREQSEDIRISMIRKFAKDDTYKNYIWSNFPPRSFASCQDSNAWLLIKLFLQGRKNVLMLFNQSDEESVLKFPDGEKIVPLLLECDDFEYYLTSEDYEYLICFNHHDSLMAAGSALPWLEKLTDEQSHLVKPVSELVSI
jgi:hypothetical protein